MKNFLGFGLNCFLGACLLPIAAWASAPDPATAVSDEFLRGYAAAVVKMNFASSAGAIRVEKGVVYIENVALSEDDKISLQRMLSESEGFVRLEVVKPSSPAAHNLRPKRLQRKRPFR